MKKNPMKGRRHSEESKKKMSAAKKGKYSGRNNPNHGRKHSPATKAAIANRRKKLKWIIDPITAVQKAVPGEKVEEYLRLGWVLGRKI